MTVSKPWFVVFKPGDENHPNSPWLRVGARSLRRTVVVPTWPIGWLLLVGFIFFINVIPISIWILFAAGLLSMMVAIASTILAVATLVAALVRFIQKNSVRWTPEIRQQLQRRKS